MQASIRTLSLLGSLSVAAFAQPIAVKVDVAAPGKAVSPDLVGIFFEDLSHAADGGLYAELVQNRDFEYSAADRDGWTPLTAWQLVQRDGAQGSVAVETTAPLNENNSSYAVLTVEKAGGGVGLQNDGFDGFAVKAGDRYNLSLFARQLAGSASPLVVRLETKTGAVLAEARLPSPATAWSRCRSSGS